MESTPRLAKACQAHGSAYGSEVSPGPPTLISSTDGDVGCRSTPTPRSSAERLKPRCLSREITRTQRSSPRLARSSKTPTEQTGNGSPWPLKWARRKVRLMNWLEESDLPARLQVKHSLTPLSRSVSDPHSTNLQVPRPDPDHYYHPGQFHNNNKSR